MKNKNLLQESIDEVLEEAFGGASGGGAGTFAYAQQAGAQTHSPGQGLTRSPRNRGTTTAPTPAELLGILDHEETMHKAPPRRPFPLETVDDFLVAAWEKLDQAEQQLEIALHKNTTVAQSKEHEVLLDHSYKKVQALKQMIFNVSQDLAKITL
jgi:hypothetical protein